MLCRAVRNPEVFCAAGEKPGLLVLTADGAGKLWSLLLVIKSALKPRLFEKPEFSSLLL